MMAKNGEATQADHGKNIHDDVETLRKRLAWDALQGALSMLGESSMKAVMHHLSKRGVNINSINIKELDHVLYSLFGDGANVIINEMCKRLEKEYLRLGLDIGNDTSATMKERMIRLMRQ